MNQHQHQHRQLLLLLLLCRWEAPTGGCFFGLIGFSNDWSGTDEAAAAFVFTLSSSVTDKAITVTAPSTCCSTSLVNADAVAAGVVEPSLLTRSGVVVLLVVAETTTTSLSVPVLAVALSLSFLVVVVVPVVVLLVVAETTTTSLSVSVLAAALSL